ncbi:MAG: FAD-dependent oxidoreductase [Chitinophagaceae bacterium]
MNYNIIIVGAGASGLIAARELSAKGYSCCVLEAASFPGGRIHTTKEEFSLPTELGAEFIHGELPLTLSLLNESGITYLSLEGEFKTIRNGQPFRQPYYQQQFIDQVDLWSMICL